MNDEPQSLKELRRQVAELQQENAGCRSEIQRLESAQRDCEQRFKALVYHLPEKVFHKDRQSVYVSCNWNYAVDFGLAPEQMVGKTDYDLFRADVAEKYRADDQRIMASGGTEEIEESYYGSSGEKRLIRTVKAALRDEQGKVAGILGIFSDITDRKRAEETMRNARDELERGVAERTAELTEANLQLQREVEERERIGSALRQSKERYELAARGAGVGIWDWDLRTGKVYYSPRWKQLFGYEDHEIGDAVEDWASRLHPEERASILQLQDDFLAGTETSVTAEYRLRHGDGTYRWILAHAIVVRDEQGKACRLVGSHGDITDRKKAELALRTTDAELIAAAQIQAYLLPHEAPRVAGFDIAGRCYSAKAAAGDLFDFLWRPDGSLLVVLGDVSGHGLGPAIVAADFCARLRTLSDLPCDLPEMAEKVNSGLCKETAGEVFVTAILGRLDPESRSFTCLNAGHPPAVILTAAGNERTRLQPGGLPFAVLENTPFYANAPLDLASGELLFFYTDGLTEAHRDKEPQFGLERALQVVRDNQERTAAEIIEAVYQAACQHIATDNPKDDITVVVVKVLARASESTSADAPVAGLDTNLFVPGGASAKPHLVECESFAVEPSDDAMVVRFVDPRHFDTSKYAQLQDDLLDFVERQKPRRLLVDLGNIEYCSTALINTLLMAQKRVQSGPGVMKLFSLQGVLLEAMQHLKLIDTVFSVHADETAAKKVCP